MKTIKTTLSALAAAAALTAGSAHAGLIGSFVDQGAGLYTFEVTNTDAVLYNAFDLTFSGNFLQGFGAGVVKFSNTTDGLAFGQPDTYFFQMDGQTELPVSSSESLTTLQGIYAFGGGGGISPSETQVVAVFSTSDSQAPTLVSGLASAGSGMVEIVPEPTSLALLALGGLMAARRRRA